MLATSKTPSMFIIRVICIISLVSNLFAEKAYVANSNGVSVIDTLSNVVITTVGPVGREIARRFLKPIDK